MSNPSFLLLPPPYVKSLGLVLGSRDFPTCLGTASWRTGSAGVRWWRNATRNEAPEVMRGATPSVRRSEDVAGLGRGRWPWHGSWWPRGGHMLRFMGAHQDGSWWLVTVNEGLRWILMAGMLASKGEWCLRWLILMIINDGWLMANDALCYWMMWNDCWWRLTVG